MKGLSLLSIVLFALIFWSIIYFVVLPDTRVATVSVAYDNFINEFTVQKNDDEPEEVRKEVAKRLNSLCLKGDKLVTELKARDYPTKDSAERLYSRWFKMRHRNNIRETGRTEKSAAYTVNKGDEMRICVRDKKVPNKFENENTSMFVLIHELAHLASESWGHGDEFRDNFGKMTKVATEIGVYQYQDFRRNSENYCGTEITNPAYA